MQKIAFISGLILLTGCPAVLTLTLDTSAVPQNTPSGELYEVTAQLTSKTESGAGVTIAFSAAGSANPNSSATQAQSGSASVSPTSAVTDPYGKARTFLFVPYGSQAVLEASAAGYATSKPVPSSGVASVTLSYESMTPGSPTSLGQVNWYQFKATVAGAGDAGPAAVVGLPVTFTTIGATGAAASPASVPTNSNGEAGTNVLMPDGGTATLVVTGGGAVTVRALP